MSLHGLDEDQKSDVHDDGKLSNSLPVPITLNVGGVKYQTTTSTLSVCSNSMLCKMFDGRFSLKPSPDGTYFIDRDGTYFGLILNFLRNGELLIPNHNQEYVIEHLLLEARFYQLQSLFDELAKLKFGAISRKSKILSADQIFHIHSMVQKKKNEKASFEWSLLFAHESSHDHGEFLDGKTVDQMIKSMGSGQAILIVIKVRKRICGIVSNIPWGHRGEKMYIEQHAIKFQNEAAGFIFDLVPSVKRYPAHPHCFAALYRADDDAGSDDWCHFELCTGTPNPLADYIEDDNISLLDTVFIPDGDPSCDQHCTLEVYRL